ncbi:hypothetical protein SLEP1_g14878 [Rubroshorea leprosula]|uniref:Uncharacterized protein n=1 Tax=Rubroshorea leprosula TaxID=152421 RepID=A0AAV5IUL5_9ROSI|nr:hypothetical protein SLEP1_g14878 [Rubroshorea leprosula]
MTLGRIGEVLHQWYDFCYKKLEDMDKSLSCKNDFIVGGVRMSPFSFQFCG